MIRSTRKALLVGLLAAAGVVAMGQAATEPTTRPAEEKVPTVAEIVNNTNRVSYYQGADGRAQVSITVVDAQGRKRNPEFTILRRDQPKPGIKPEDRKKHDDFCGEQKFYVYFHRPPDLSKMGFLVWKHLDKDDDRWLYLPKLDLVKRIASAEKRTSFVGSHFFYEDVSGRSIKDDTHTLVETTNSYYVLKNTPKDPKSVEFGHFVMYIHRKTFLVVRTDYYDKQGELYRRYRALEVKQIQGYHTVTKSRMDDLRSKGYTLLEYSDVKYDLGVEEEVFAERYLRKPPQKYLR